MVLSMTAVRHAEPEDLPLVQDVEAQADRQFDEYMDTSGWAAPPTGEERAARGAVLIIGQPVLGFVHVIELDGRHHLDALAVRPHAQRRSEALKGLDKGKMTETPVKSQFGYHIIRLDDVRDAKAPEAPAFDADKDQIKERMLQQKVANYQQELRDKAKVE